MILKTLEPNLEGRDFVVGDLHGCLDLLFNLLVGVDFDPDKDRLISVGDLADRGPDSLGCLQLLLEPWFHSARGNHEDLMLYAFGQPEYYTTFWVKNGGQWGAQALADMEQLRAKHAGQIEALEFEPAPQSTELFKLLPIIRELPSIITVKLKDGRRFHVLHAELPRNWKPTDESLSSSSYVGELSSECTRDSMPALQWSRTLFKHFQSGDNDAKLLRSLAYELKVGVNPFNDKLSHIISGHTILAKPVTLLGQTNIDTGAFTEYWKPGFGGALTMVELDTWTFYQATKTKFRTVEPVVVNSAMINASTSHLETGADMTAAIDLLKGTK
jgi:serine/threonine protein phosphatase 1